ncbi:MAG: hypothetical protein HYV07_01210 [Deltaproteobacteria bacterium]|nr:hypothetical protein [Deltaproteobacteria bacterium]
MSRTIAALDLGSNTLKLTIARVRSDGLDVLDETSRITRIGEGLDRHGRLLDQAMSRTMLALAELSRRCADHGVDEIRCVGTAGLRGAANAREFLERVRLETGIVVEIIDGLREAELTFSAPAGQFGPSPIVVLDLGGRSTEVVAGVGTTIHGRVSLEMGSVRLTERFLPDDPPRWRDVERVLAHAREVLMTAPDASPGARLVGVSGTIISLLGLSRGLTDVEEAIRAAETTTLSKESVTAELSRLAAIPASERVFGSVLPPLRADVIVAGAAIALATFERYRADHMFVTHRGVRYGLLEEAKKSLA